MVVSEKHSESWQVFINFRGKELRSTFISHLVRALKEAEINYYIDTKETPSEELSILFTRIEQSEIALVIFSSMYAESEWCLNELVRIVEQMKKGKLKIIPVFLNVKVEDVRDQKGEFAVKLYGGGRSRRANIPDWENALNSVPSKIGLSSENFSNESDLVEKIVDSVKRVLARVPPVSIGGGGRRGGGGRGGAGEGGGGGRGGGGGGGGDNSTDVSVEQPKTLHVDYGMIQRPRVNKESAAANVDTFSLQDQEKGEKLRSSKILPLLRGQCSSSTNDHGIAPPLPMPPPTLPLQYRVFINFRGDEIGKGFVGRLEKGMRSAKINVFATDEVELTVTNLFGRIEESRVAVAIFSERYTESCCCLDELVKMKEKIDQGKLVVIPVFYRLDATDCKRLDGAFGVNFGNLASQYWTETERIRKWKEALASVSNNNGLIFHARSDESKFVDSIVERVKKVLIEIVTKDRGNSKNPTREREEVDTTPRFGVEQRLKQLEEKLQFGNEQTRFVGVVGMHGVGKTTLAKMLYEKWEHKFESGMFFQDVGKMSKEHGPDWLRKRIMQELLQDVHTNIGYEEDAHEFWKDDLLNRKVFLVLDDVRGKKQIKSLLGKRTWIKKGSKIVLTSTDESLLQDQVDDKYVVTRLNSRDSSLCFNNHAFGLDFARGNFMKLSRNFLDYAKGNPLALKALGVELRGRDEAYWEQRSRTLKQSCSKMIQDVLRRRYDELTRRQKDAFLDIACFFRSENASFVRCLVDSCDSGFTKARDEMRDLSDKFLVNISGGRVEMPDLLCTFAKELAAQALTKKTGVQFRLWNHQDISYVLENKLEMENVRGVFLDMSQVPEEMRFLADILSNMCNLLYLNIRKYDLKIGISKEFQLPSDELRYLHWPKFPLEKLPSNFKAKKLVNLELPYSLIKQLWEGVKETPKLKWVDLSFSRKLRNLSGLSNAENLERLNLEGCRSLVNFPKEMENMKSLIVLNMRCCVRLRFIPKMKLSSLKILILSDCSRLEQFEVISINLEALYLDGTALKQLPPATGNLERLAILNLKGCERLESLPECLGKQKALEELILSGCSKLKSVPENIENMRYLHILLLDGTRVKEMPTIYSLQRLCLSRNNAMIHLQNNITQLHHLKWLDLHNCENLSRLPTLPPNLEFFNARGCGSLEAVANPFTLRMMTEQIRSTFFFINCNSLKQDARGLISSYAQWKCHRLALECYDRGVVSGALFNLCYPGFEVPSWFHHQAVGSVLEPRLQPRWCNNRLSGIALCAVVSFHDNQDLIDTFAVKCRLQLENEDGSRTSLDCDVGGITEPGSIQSDHVFIGYASCSHLAKRMEDQDSIRTKAFLEFYVTDAGKTEVVNCGMSFVYAEPHHVPVDANRYTSSSRKRGGWIGDFLVYIILALFCVMVFAPRYYLKFLKFFGPQLVLFLCALALGRSMDRKDGKPKQQKGSQ